MSEIIKSQLEKEYAEMQERILTLESQLSETKAENARLERCIARKDGIIKGLAYSVRCNGVSGSEIGGLE